MARLILLDRDGVINFDSPDYIKTPHEWRPIPGSMQAIATIRSKGFKVGVCTNQAGIARGRMSLSDLEEIHAKLRCELGKLNAGLDELMFCPHHPDVGCGCRKPEPGMLLEVMRNLSVSAQHTAFVGDSMTDIQAAAAAGCQAVLVRTGRGRQTEADLHDLQLDVPVFDDLASYVEKSIA